MAEFKLISSETVFESPLFDVASERAEHPGGAVLDRKVVRNPPAAVIVPRDAVGRVLLIRQYRLPPREYLWEAPAGRCDPGEKPLETARRELAEETGYRAARWRRLTEFYPAPGFASERMTAFLAEDLTPGEPAPEPYEVIEPRWFEWPAALEMIRAGEVRDAKTIAALLYCAAFTEAEP